MASIIFNTSINLNKNKILKPSFENRTTEPISLKNGHLYYDTNKDRLRYYKDIQWVDVRNQGSYKPFYSLENTLTSLLFGETDLKIFENVRLSNPAYTVVNNETLEFNEDGTYLIKMTGSLDNSFNNRRDISGFLVADKGDGFGKVSNSEFGVYSRNANDGKGSFDCTITYVALANDRIRLRMDADDEMETIPQTCTCVIIKLYDYVDISNSQVSNSVSALSFNGLDEYVNFGNIRDFDIGQPFSVSAWVNPESISPNSSFDTNIIASKGGWFFTSAHQIGWSLRYYITSNTLGIGIRDDTFNSYEFNSSGNTVPEGVWSHVLFTYDGGNTGAAFNIYINGVSQTISGTTNVFTSFQNTTENHYIGAAAFDSGTTDAHFDGIMDEVSFFTRELSASEAVDLYNNTDPTDVVLDFANDPDLQSHYRMGRSDTNTTLFDSINTNNGTKMNMTTTNTVTR